MKGGEHLTVANPNLTNPQIKYYRLRLSMSDFMPSETSKADFTSIKADAEIAAAHGQGLALSIGAGPDSPAWLIAKCATLTNEDGVKFPAPWDANFKAAWTAFVAEAGKQLDPVPNLFYVCVTGGNGKNNEWRLNIKTVLSAGEIESYVSVSKEFIDLFAASFPTTPFIMTEGSDAYPGDKDLATQLGDYGSVKYPHRFGNSYAGFKANSSTSYVAAKLIIKYAGKNPSFVQQISPSDDPLYGGTFEQSIALLKVIPANCMEIYKTDLAKVTQATNDALSSSY